MDILYEDYIYKFRYFISLYFLNKNEINNLIYDSKLLNSI